MLQPNLGAEEKSRICSYSFKTLEKLEQKDEDEWKLSNLVLLSEKIYKEIRCFHCNLLYSQKNRKIECFFSVDC